MVTPAGFEPGIAAVKGRCPIRLDERVMSAPQGSCFYLCGNPRLKGIAADNNVVNPDTQNSRQNDDVVQRRHCLAPLPLVNGLGIAEPESVLEIPYSQSGLLPQTDDISSGRGHVNDRPHVHLICAPFRP